MIIYVAPVDVLKCIDLFQWIWTYLNVILAEILVGGMLFVYTEHCFQLMAMFSTCLCSS